MLYFSQLKNYMFKMVPLGKLGKYKEAIISYENAYKIDPKFAIPT